MTNLPLPATVQENFTVQRVLEESVRLLTDARTDAPKAEAEWLSVPAFSQLAEQLHYLGAPEALIGKTLSAKDDEIRQSVAEIKKRIL